MDYETRLMQARLDAIEDVMLNLIGGDQRKLDEVRVMLSGAYRSAYDKQREENGGGFQTSVRVEMRPPRDTAGESAKTAAYKHLCHKFGAPIDR